MPLRPDPQSSTADREPGRDVRLDLCRGVALWFVFLDHVPNNIGSWLTLSHYGFSDATEVFMFVSGATCALAYGRVRRHDGWLAAASHALLRSWEIYVAFLMLIIACVVMVYLAGGAQFADETNTRVLLEPSGTALAHAAILQYRPVNTDVFADLHRLSPVVRPVALGVVQKSECSAWRIALALSVGSGLRLEPAAMAD